MIQLNNRITPVQTVLDQLAEWQAEITGTFAEKSEEAKRLFSIYNKPANRIFLAIKESLVEMCSGAKRCVYCEDSYADEIEHIYPKSLYPDLVFVWSNYVYACGVCNGSHKNNKFAVYRADNGQFTEVNPPNTRTQPQEPPAGEAVFINQREENPFNFCILGLSDTLKFIPIFDQNSREFERFNYTYNILLKLNDEARGEDLCDARREAYVSSSPKALPI